MAVLTLQEVSHSFGVRKILEEISFQVNEGEKIGVIGGNGAGKTTLFKLITGELIPDEGSVRLKGGTRLGYLAQNTHIDSTDSLYEECKKGYFRAFQIEEKMKALEKKMGEDLSPEALNRVMEEYQFLTGRFESEGGLSYDSEIRGILKGVGFSPERFDDSVQVLSGGEKARLELARMLCGRPELLLLDEPTNHLDLSAISFLESFLSSFRGAALLISHDRYFLDQLIDRTFLIENRRLLVYNCGYGDFAKRREKDREVQAHAYLSQQEEIARLEEMIERLSHLGGSKRKRGISQARSRQKLLDKMARIEAPSQEKEGMAFHLKPKYESGKDVLEVVNLSKSFGERALFQEVSFYLGRGQKVGLIGENGVGKTTLFRLLLKKMSPDGGEISYGTAVKTAFFDQEQQTLHLEKTVIDELWDAYPHLDHHQVRKNLAKFQFEGDEIFREVGELSGGERSRLALLKLMLSSANLLLLDEPTNHLDADSCEILENALLDYEGTVFVISHDRYFLNRVADHIFKLTPQGMECHLGNYDDYRKDLEKAEDQTALLPESGLTKTAQKKKDREKRKAQKERRKERAIIQDLARKIEEKEKEKADLEKTIADPALYEDYEKVRALNEAHAELIQELDRLQDQWLERSLELEEEE